MLRRSIHVCLALLIPLVLVPHTAWAQAAIAGVVTDTTGAVLPGVTVEARSPALIEQVKTVVTDSNGQYRVVDLRPGTYSVTYSLAGFSRVLREGITLESNFTADVDIQLRLGAIEETVTVTGAAPVVDVQNSQRREVLVREDMDVLPTGRTYANVARTLPALAVGGIDVGGSLASENIGSVTAYGGPGQHMNIDGMSVAPGQGNGTSSVIFLNHGAVQEYVFQVNGGFAETQTGGVQVNMIPKTGGNTFSGWGVAVWANSALQAVNASDEQLAAGLEAPAELNEVYDYNFSLGGPVIRNRLWFFNSYRWWTYNDKLSLLHDGKMGPAGEQVVNKNLDLAFTGRLTGQLAEDHKVTVMYEWAPRREYFNNVTSQLRRPEATGRAIPKLSYVAQAKWTATLSPRVLAEAGWSGNFRGYQGRFQDVIRKAEQLPPYGDIAKFDAFTSYYFNNTSNEWYNPFWRHQTTGSVAYVTGSNSFKTGFQASQGSYRTALTSNGDIIQRYRAGVPFAVEVLPTPIDGKVELDLDLGIYAQHTYTHKRLTITPGLRFDKFVGRIPEQSMPAGRFLPARRFDPIEDLPNWTDISPRLGGSFDLFGNGKTALKGSVGRYVAPESMAIQIRFNPSALPGVSGAAATGDVRDWTDLNGDDIAQETEIGPSRNPSFGIARNSNPDPDLRRGYDLLYNVAVEHELRSNLGLSVGYNRRDVKNLAWVDNLANVPADYELLLVPDPRGNGEMLPVFQLMPSRVFPLNELEKNSDVNSRTYNGVDVFVHGRLPNGGFFSAGTSTGRVIGKTCQTENPNSLRFCDQGDFDIPLLTAIKASGNYPLPYGFRMSAVLQSLPGAERSVTYVVTRAQAPQLSTVSSVTVRLNEPGTLYRSRINQLDFSVGKTISVQKFRVSPQIEVFNVLNVNSVLSETNVYPAVGRPISIMPGRLLRLGAQVEF